MGGKRKEYLLCPHANGATEHMAPCSTFSYSAATPEIIGPPDNPRNADIINSITVFRLRILSLSDPDPQHFAWIILPDST